VGETGGDATVTLAIKTKMGLARKHTQSKGNSYGCFLIVDDKERVGTRGNIQREQEATSQARRNTQ